MIRRIGNWVLFSFLAIFLAACTTDPENTYALPSRQTDGLVYGTGAGAAIGMVAQTSVPWAALGGLAGGGLIGYIASSEPVIRKQLQDAGIKIIQHGDNLVLLMRTDDMFEFNSGTLKENHYATLNLMVRLLKAYAGIPVTIIAHTDNVASPEYNEWLTGQQAQSLASYFWSHGIAYQRLHPMGYGKIDPIANNSTISGTHMNRRIEVILSWVRPPMKQEGNEV